MDSIDELDMHEAQMRLTLYNEYRDAVRLFAWYVETELRAYLCNEVTVVPHAGESGVYFEVSMTDVWIYEAERISRFVPEARVWAMSDVHVQRLKAEE